MSRLTFAVLMTLVGSVAQAATLDDLTQWTLVEDPADPGMVVLDQTTDSIRLRANGPVPSGTDIGFASVDGQTVASSTSGYFFDPSNDFTVAIDFDFLSRSTTGAGGIGFGIGEDIDGTDSAGVGLGFLNGAPVAFSTAGRVNDIDEPLELFTTMPTSQTSAGGAIIESSGRFFVEYDSATADVILGISTTKGANAPDETKTLSGIGNQWDGDDLLVSFFLRSQAIGNLVPGIDSGLVDGTFGSLVVLEGSSQSVPEPASALLVGFALAALPSRGRKTAD